MRQPQPAPRDFFASDHHMGHKSVIAFCNRPYDDLPAMEKSIIHQHNSVVRPGDRVWLIGDFSFYDAQHTNAILSQMNGQKFLIKGNHDHSKMIAGLNIQTFQYKELKLGDDTVVLHHFPMLSWNRQHYGSYHLHGHSHGSLRYPSELKSARIFDVGIDNIYKLFGSYAPMSWESVKAEMSSRGPSSLDHHDPRKSLK